MQCTAKEQGRKGGGTPSRPTQTVPGRNPRRGWPTTRRSPTDEKAEHATRGRVRRENTGGLPVKRPPTSLGGPPSLVVRRARRWGVWDGPAVGGGGTGPPLGVASPPSESAVKSAGPVGEAPDARQRGLWRGYIERARAVQPSE